ncbi:hypothetical protein Hrd1104_07785 [Halorhabdus sp. CBA1104]|nr:hypothetical protein Hrd1104_07785 [Halorhabdus sp. CBA1104]
MIDTVPVADSVSVGVSVGVSVAVSVGVAVWDGSAVSVSSDDEQPARPTKTPADPIVFSKVRRETDVLFRDTAYIYNYILI